MGTSKRRLPTGTVTFMFTDIEGSTRLLQALGASYPRVLEEHASIIRDSLAAHRGVEVSTEGDSFFAVFPSATDAVAAAVELQRRLAGHRWPEGHPVNVRVGLHPGEGRLSGDSYVGLDVHRAAQISAAGHGGQVLVSAALRALAEGELPEGVTVRDLGVHRLKDLEQPEHLGQLNISGLEHDFPALRSLETPSQLPLELTSFVGRQREVDEATALLATTRLLTLTGPGGTGKTRLAIRTAAGLSLDFADGVFFVDLAPLTDPALVGPTVARTLGLSDQAERPIVDLLTEYLEPRQLLLVLDNFEHVLPAREVVDELLAAAPGLRALITSRSILNLYGEQEYAVAPLALPDPSAAVDADELSRYEAVALFIERARTAKQDFTITDDSARAVAQICVRLDGLPLAIELAASRVRLLEPKEILDRLEKRLPTLMSGASNVPIRQRTLRGAIEWSYELLDPAEQVLFVRLAAFAGGCTLEAAEVVCNPGNELGLETFEGITSLVDQSLIRRRGDGGESRFSMLETIREYGRDRLEADGGLDEIGRRHLGYFRDLAEQAEPHFMGTDQVAWLDRFEREHDNVRVALRRSLDSRDSQDGLRLAAALWRFWLQRGYLREGRSWLEACLSLEPGAISESRAKAYNALGGLTYWLADVDATQEAYGSAVRLYDGIGDPEAKAEALYNLAFVPVMRGENEEAYRRFIASEALARQVGRSDLVAQNQRALGLTAAISGRPEAGLTLLEEALRFFRGIGDELHVGWTRAEMGRVYQVLGDYEAGRMAYVEALRQFAGVRNLPGIGAMLEGIAALESSAGRHREAAHVMGAADTLRTTTGASPPPGLTRVGDVEGFARQAIGETAFEAALEEGKRMTLDEAIEYAVSSLTDALPTSVEGVP